MRSSKVAFNTGITNLKAILTSVISLYATRIVLNALGSEKFMLKTVINNFKTETDPYKALEGAHAIAVLKEWDEFTTYDWQHIYNNMQMPAFVFDGRNVLDRKELEAIGFLYYSIG